MMFLTGDKNQCPSCLEYFSTVRNFDKHRKGTWKARYCAHPSDVGLVKNDEGFWVQKPPKNTPAKLQGSGDSAP